MGFRITPLLRHPSEVSSVPLFMLPFQHGFQTGFAYQKAVVNPNFKISLPSDHKPNELLIDVSGQHTGQLRNEAYLLQSLVAPWVSSQRNVLLADLRANGFGTFEPQLVNPTLFATKQALTDWPMVEMIGA